MRRQHTRSLPLPLCLMLALSACGAGPDEGGALPDVAGDAEASPGADGNVDAATTDGASARPGTAVDPSDDILGWIAVDWLGLDIPIEQWAGERTERQYRVDEFNAEEATARELAMLRDARRSGTDIGHIRLTLDGSLSDYDQDYGEYYIQAFSPGSRFTFRPFRSEGGNPFTTGVDIRFRNGGDASIWAVDAVTAEKVAQQLGYGRPVRIEASLVIADVTATDRGAVILADVERYTLYSRDGERLGEIRVNGAVG